MKWFLVAVFVVLIVGLSWVGMRKTHGLTGFLLGNRAIGPWVSAFAYGTTYFSAVLFIGYAGKVGWGFGLSSLWIVLGNALLGTYLAWKVLARRTREMTSRLDAITLPAFLEVRYQSKALRIAAALIIFVFMIPYSASAYMGLSYLFEEVFKVPYVQALLFMTVLTGLVIIMGGYIGVALVDMFQGVVMIVGALILVYFVVADPHVGGIAAGISKLAAINPVLASPVGPPGLLAIAGLVVLTSLGAWGMPQMLQKFYAIRDEQAVKRGAVVSTCFALLITFAAYFTGSFGRLFFDSVPVWNGRPNPDVIMPQIITQVMPEWAVLMILLLVLSATMTTLSSLVMVSSTTVAVDLIQAWLLPEMSRQRVIQLIRLLCALFVGLSLYLAISPNKAILSLMGLSWGTIAGAFLGPYVLGLFWRGATRAGAWAGMVVGAGTTVVLAFYYQMDASVVPIISSASMLLSLAVVFLVSLFTRPLPEKHVARVFGDAATGDKVTPGVETVGMGEVLGLD